MRAAMKPLPTLMKPLAFGRSSVGRARRGAGRAKRRRRRRGAGGSRGGGGRLRTGPRRPREVRRRRPRRLRRRVARVPGADPLATHALNRHLVLVGFMGAGKTTIGEEVARRLGREFLDVDHEIELREGAADLCRARRGGVPRGGSASSRAAASGATRP